MARQEIPSELPFEDRLLLVLLWRIHLANGTVIQRIKSGKAFATAVRQAERDAGLDG